MDIRCKFKGKVYYVNKGDKFHPAGWVEHLSWRTWARSHKYCIPALAFSYFLLVTKATCLNIPMDMVECRTNRIFLLVKHYTALQRYPVEHSYFRDWHCFLPLCELARLLTFTIFFFWTPTVFVSARLLQGQLEQITFQQKILQSPLPSTYCLLLLTFPVLLRQITSDFQL